ncbi:hypothetical protein GF312_09315 [Candidatus Poribacteria bacterium]|nr:hypothetical protein [Candidatus Poribacteria bacterium]
MLSFADHLYDDEDYLRAAEEYKRYIFLSTDDKNNILYKIGLCYRLASKNDLAVEYFRKTADNTTNDRLKHAAVYQTAYTYFLAEEYDKSITIIDNLDVKEKNWFYTLKSLNYLHQRKWYKARDILDQIKNLDERLIYIIPELKAKSTAGINMKRKKPILAALFSAVLPGSGKIYCGEIVDGLYSFAVVGLSGLLAWDGFRKNDVNSIQGWIFGSLSVVFYSGNIYGSALSARVYNYSKENDIINSIPKLPEFLP